ncbi:bifunctional diguanylate cyclase/phosphodiesterase [Paenibacillus riograndensis]|uniref:Diguanylate cyclase/phosphodiesterase with MHYT sensor n=1 Tax=Paenibacillus riograndensis SBR5 TaxID=1073571 RepID=A0A0E4CZP3_9BACL|nr:EAL domain-containing protein [Paenibacillus riograndensis]CQR58757.1 diguanylate cyclase/phosphodiesterase with MHYT sensor [Paenibacillus riograndensis SBR5]
MDQMGIHYNLWIVLLSFALAATAAYSALNLILQVFHSAGRVRRLWLLSSACVLGSGIWAMHFVGVMASYLPFKVSYHPGIAGCSLLISMCACYLSLWVATMSPLRTGRLLLSGMILGSGISMMHYMGMYSMKLQAEIHYETLTQGLSVVVACVVSYAAVFLFHKFKDYAGFSRWKLYSAVFIGLAVTGMHYISLRASILEVDNWTGTRPLLIESDVVLLTGVSLVTLFMLAVSCGAVFLDRHVLERMAYHDPLTELPNRHGLERYFKGEFFGGHSGAVFFVDLDRFKSINDTLGHDIGDMLLQEVAGRLRGVISAKGKVFRLGGDEFLIALPVCTMEDAREEAQHILRELKKAYSIEGNELYVTASVGISMTPLHGTDRSALMKAADTALYTSKDSGKNKFSVFDQEMNRHQLRRMSLEKDLRKALARSEFMVVYQPKWDSLMNVTVGLEALLRWRHPEHGIISPAEFIPIAEETGLIVPITYWMLHDVCGQNKLWHKACVANVAVSINMSARMFEGGSLYDVVEEALVRSGLEPHFLELEITESIAMNNMEETVAQLSKLRNLGVRVSLDDFGTGFSSLGNLDEIPVNTLKIDQVFIRKSKMHSKKAIISNIIAIASNLNMEVVAEGVETPEQIELLQSLGCRVMQGFYYGRPMPVSELGQWFIENTA